MSRTVTIFKVPPGTKPTRCKGPTCGRSFFWVRQPKGTNVPVDCDVEGMQRPSEATDLSQLDAFSGKSTVYEGYGVSHHSVCPDVSHFR